MRRALEAPDGVADARHASEAAHRFRRAVRARADGCGQERRDLVEEVQRPEAATDALR
jgi:hypothetical protein